MDFEGTLNFTENLQGKQCTLLLDGEMVFYTLPMAKSKLNLYVNNSSIEKLILDLNSVPHMDSLGIGFILMMHNNLKKRGAQFFITNPNPTLKKILDLSGLLQVIKIL